MPASASLSSARDMASPSLQVPLDDKDELEIPRLTVAMRPFSCGKVILLCVALAMMPARLVSGVDDI